MTTIVKINGVVHPILPVGINQMVAQVVSWMQVNEKNSFEISFRSATWGGPGHTSPETGGKFTKSATSQDSALPEFDTNSG